MNNKSIKSAIESILFVAGDAIEIDIIADALSMQKDELNQLIDDLIEEKKQEKAGVLLTKVNNRIQLCSNPNNMAYIEKALQPVKKSRLSQSLLETLSIIAYEQPVTRAEIEQIRGVKCNYSVAMLIEKGLIQRAGRKKTLGNPMLYKTNDEFLRHFGITSLEELPELQKAE